MSIKKKVTLTLAEKVKAALNIGDKGKVDSFFIREEKNFKRELKVLSRRLENNSINAETEIEVFEDKIFDAEGAIENALTNLDVKKISTNASQDEYSETFWNRVLAAEVKLENLKEEKVKTLEKYNKKGEDIQKDIDKCNRRILAITGE